MFKTQNFSRISKALGARLETIVRRKGCWLLTLRTHVIKLSSTDGGSFGEGWCGFKGQPFCPRETLRVRGWLQVCVKTHEYALSTRLLNGGHVALKGHRIWAREVFFTKNQVNGARIHPIPSFSLSFPSSSPSILFPLFVIYSLRLILSIFLIFSFSFLPLYFIRGEGNRRRRRRNVRQSYQVALSLLLSREADGVVSMNDA